ncbi:MAG: hypothetical protein J7501_00630 [Bdellovibrio sp.]|nr:hypothetical protein [Bdellovibrio sp.]
MKSLVIALVIAAPMFASANCVSEMMAGAAQGNREVAADMCRTSEKVCNVSEIIKNNAGLNYASAIALCQHKLESNAALISCIAKGYSYSTCAQN